MCQIYGYLLSKNELNLIQTKSQPPCASIYYWNKNEQVTIKTTPGKLLILQFSSTIVYCVHSKSQVRQYGRHSDHPHVISIVSILCEIMGIKLATNSVNELDTNEIFMSGSLSSLFELYTLEYFNIYLSTDKTINRKRYVSSEF